MSVPSQEELVAALGSAWKLGDSLGQTVDCVVFNVESSQAMSPEYTCYSVMLKLPENTAIGQGTYNLISPAGQEWPLMMTPMQPGADGRHQLQIVFHYKKPIATH